MRANDDNFLLFFVWTIALSNLTYTLKVILIKLSRNESSHGFLCIVFCRECYHQSLTWPLNLIGVAQVVWGGDKHFSISDWWPERDHVELSVVTNRSIFLRIGHCSCCISTVNTGHWNMKLFYGCMCVCVFYQQCAAAAIHQKWHQWTCEAGQRWGRLVTGESVHLCHLETNEPGCADSSLLGHSFPEERCNLVTQQNTN